MCGPVYLKTFLRDSRGGAPSVEFAILFPGIVAILIFLADVGYALFNRSVAVTAIEDANRSRSVGDVTTDAETVAAVKNGVQSSRFNDAAISSSVVAGVVYTTMTVRYSDLDIFGSITRMMGDFDITITSQQTIENLEA